MSNDFNGILQLRYLDREELEFMDLEYLFKMFKARLEREKEAENTAYAKEIVLNPREE